jgi:hypothetical protein
MNECPLCHEIVVRDTRVLHTPEGPRLAHRECMLRDVMGGIGHLIAHDYWCTQRDDPDAGLTRHQSARLVDAFSHIVGIGESAKAVAVPQH